MKTPSGRLNPSLGPCRREVVAEAVQYDVGRTDAAGSQCRCPAPGVGTVELSLVDRARRGEDPRHGRVVGEQPTERRQPLLQRREGVLAQHRYPVEIGDPAELRAHVNRRRSEPRVEGGYPADGAPQGVQDLGTKALTIDT